MFNQNLEKATQCKDPALAQTSSQIPTFLAIPEFSPTNFRRWRENPPLSYEIVVFLYNTLIKMYTHTY